MTKRENKAHLLKDLIPQMLKENKLQKGMNQLAVEEAWKDVMGNGVVSYTESILLKGNILIVKLSSSALREELSYGKERIIEMLNNSLKSKLVKTVKLL